MNLSRSLAALRGFAIALAAVAALAATPGCQPKYEPLHTKSTGRVWKIGGVDATVEIADDKESRNRGLMFRKSLPADHGMLFVYPTPRILRFWMRNTAIPLSIAFIEETGNGKGRVVNVEEMQPFVETGTVSLAPIRLALEMPQGWFTAHQIKAGDVIDVPTWVAELVPRDDE